MEITVSHERIYQFIWQDMQNQGSLYLDLRNRGRRYKKRSVIYDKRGTIPNRTDISLRPPEVECSVERFGDLEIDLIDRQESQKRHINYQRQSNMVCMLNSVSWQAKMAEQLVVATIDCLKDWNHIFTQLHLIMERNFLSSNDSHGIKYRLSCQTLW